MPQYYLSINRRNYIPYIIVKMVILMAFDKEYNFEKDIYVMDYFDAKDDLRKDTVDSYKFSLNQFSEANEETITNIIENCLEQQKSRVETNGQITEFNPDQPNSLIKRYINNFEKYCKEKGNRNTSITDKRDNIFVFLKHYNVKMPRRKKYEDDKKQWNKLSKEDVRYILKDCNIVEQALITFMLSTGLRRWDVSELTIGDFMEATRKMGYHNFVEVDDFIDNAPDDMIGFWDLIPHKESKNDIRCKTFNSSESSNLILQNLRRIKNEYIPNKYRKDKIEIKLEKSDALFGSRMKYYKKSLTKEAMTNAIRAKNPRFKEWKIKQIDEDIKNKKISKEDREKEIEKIPTINPHALRKVFTNAVDTYGGLSLRANLVMEGHSSPVSTDPNYMQKQKEELFEGYKRILPHLTILEELEVKILSNGESEKLNMEIKDLKKEKEGLEKQLEDFKIEKDAELAKVRKEMEQRIKEVENKVEKQLSHLDNPLGTGRITTSRNEFNYRITIEEYLFHYRENDIQDDWNKLQVKIHDLDNEDFNALREISYDIAVHDGIDNIEDTITKSIIKMKTNPSLRDKAIGYYRELELLQDKLIKLNDILVSKLTEIGLWDTKEVSEIADSIQDNINWDKLLLTDITDEFGLELINQYLVEDKI